MACVSEACGSVRCLEAWTDTKRSKTLRSFAYSAEHSDCYNAYNNDVMKRRKRNGTLQLHWYVWARDRAEASDESVALLLSRTYLIHPNLGATRAGFVKITHLTLCILNLQLREV